MANHRLLTRRPIDLTRGRQLKELARELKPGDITLLHSLLGKRRKSPLGRGNIIEYRPFSCREDIATLDRYQEVPYELSDMLSGLPKNSKYTLFLNGIPEGFSEVLKTTHRDVVKLVQHHTNYGLNLVDLSGRGPFISYYPALLRDGSHSFDEAYKNNDGLVYQLITAESNLNK